MMQRYLLQLKFLRRLLGNQSQLMIRHLCVRFVIDPFESRDRLPVFEQRPKKSTIAPASQLMILRRRL